MSYSRLLILTVSILSFSCQKEKKNIVNQWYGKTIVFPENIELISLDSTKNDYEKYHQSATIKILVYSDSTGCSACNLRLDLWRYLSSEIDSISKGNVHFLFWISSNDKEKVMKILKEEDFNYPVYIDTENQINTLNTFPNEKEYQCFLLDESNKVILIGNPILNPQIRSLYKKAIANT